MRHRFRIIYLCGYSVAIFPVIMPEHIFIFLVSRSQYDKLRILLTDLLYHTSYQIQTFLTGQSGYDTQHKSAFIDIKTKIALKTGLIFTLFFSEIPGIVLLIYVIVGCRIKFFIIYTVYYSSERILSGSHKSVQSLSEEFRLYLFGIGLTYRGHRIRINHSAL